MIRIFHDYEEMAVLACMDFTSNMSSAKYP
jgi:hypothetical protein